MFVNKNFFSSKATVCIGIIGLLALVSAAYLLSIGLIIYKEKNDNEYEFNRYAGTKLSRKSGVEQTPPGLKFDHAAVLMTGIQQIGRSDVQYHARSYEQELRGVWAGILPHQMHFNYQAILPYHGNRQSRYFYNGFANDHKLSVNLIGIDRDNLIGRRGRIRYLGGEWSEMIVISNVGNDYVNVTGDIIHNKIPEFLELEKIENRKIASHLIEKVTYLPDLEDGVLGQNQQSIALRVRGGEAIIKGDVLNIGAKTFKVQGVNKGPGIVQYVLVDGDERIIPYVDTRAGAAQIIPQAKKEENLIRIPINPVSNEIYYNGMQREGMFMSEVGDDTIAEYSLVAFDTGLVCAKFLGEGLFSFDYSSDLASKMSSKCLSISGLGRNFNPAVFGIDVKRKKNHFLISSFKNKFNDAHGVDKSKIWSGEALWATYTGILNQYYDTFNPSGIEYIIHALGVDNRKKYVDEFVSKTPQFVQTSVRNFDFTDFHGWSLTNSWDFYRLVLSAYEPIGNADYAQIWKISPEGMHEPILKNSVQYEGFPIKLEGKKKDSTCEKLILTEVEISYQMMNKFKSIPLIGKTPRLFVYVSDSLSQLPVSLPPDEVVWRFPVAHYSNQKPVLDIALDSPILANVNFKVNKVIARELIVPQERIRALFLPVEMRSSCR